MGSSLPLETLYTELLLQSIVEEQPEALTVVGLLLLGIGLFNIYMDRSKEATADRLEETDVTDIGSITDGPAAVSGIARPAGEPLDRPASDGECLAYERRTRTTRETVERTPDRDDPTETTFETTNSSTSKSTAFRIEDETGTVLIADDETPTLHLETTDSETEKPDPDVLDEKRRNRSTRDSHSVVVEREHRYSELLPGDEVFVFGQAQQRPLEDGGDFEPETDIQISADDETGDYILTHYDRDWILDEYTSDVQLIIGLVVSVLSLAFLLYIWVL